MSRQTIGENPLDSLLATPEKPKKEKENFSGKWFAKTIL